MKKNNKIPTAQVCDILSLLTVLSGICAGFFYFFLRPATVLSVLASALLMLVFLVVAVIVRILGIIGQLGYDLSHRLESLEGRLEGRLGSLQDVLNKDIHDFKTDAGQNASSLQSVIEQINCDTKDLNESIGQINKFFEMIEKHLNLKK